MKKKYLKVVSATCALAMALSLTGCGNSSGSASATASAGTSAATGLEAETVQAIGDTEGTVKKEMHYAFSAQPPTLDLHTTSTTVAYTIGRGGIYETLVTLDDNYN